MIEAIESLVNHYVGAYLALVVGTQLLLAGLARRRRARIRRQRLRQGLDEQVLIDQTETLSELRRESVTQALALLGTIFLGPAAVIGGASLFGAELSPEERQGLAVLLLGLVLWLVWSGTDVAKAFFGGLAFKTLAALKRSIQVGDRVSVRGHHGRVTEIGVFFLDLRVGGGDLVSIPTRSLWSEALVSENAGERSSRAVMRHFLSPTVTAAQLRAAEDAIWEAMQASAYLEPSKPIQVIVSQRPGAVVLTAKAFVASTYNRSRFESDVARAFLERCAGEGIPLPRRLENDAG